MRYKISLCVLYGVLELCYARKIEIGALIEFDKNVMNQLQEYMNTKDILSAIKPSHQPTEPNNKGNESFDSRRSVKDYLKSAVSLMKSYDENELCSMFNVAMGKIKKLTVNNDDTDKAILRNVKALEEIPCSDIGGILNETMLALNGKKYTGMSWLHLIDTLNTTNVLDGLKIIALTPTETLRKRNYDPDEVVRKTIRNILKVINKIHAYLEEQNRKTKHLLRQQLPKSQTNKLLGEVTHRPSMIDKIRPIIEETRKPENEDRHRILLVEHNFPSGGYVPSEQHNNLSGDHQNPLVENRKPIRGHKKTLREQHRSSTEDRNRPPRDQTKDTYILKLEKKRIARLPKKTLFETGDDLTSTTTVVPSLNAKPRKIKKAKKKNSDNLNNTPKKGPKIEKQQLEDMIKPIVSMLLHGVDINLASGEHTSSTKDPILDILYGRSRHNSKPREPTTTAESLIDNKPIVLKFI